MTQTRQRKPLKVVDYPIVSSDFPIFLRSGKVIALHNVQKTMLSAGESRLAEFYLKVGLACEDDGGNKVEDKREGVNGTRTCSASGILMFTPQTTWKFNVLNRKVRVLV